MPSEDSTQPDGYVRPKDVSVRIASDANEKLIKMAQRYKYTKRVAFNLIIDRGTDLDILSHEYTELYEALKNAGEIQLSKNRFEGLKDAPKCMDYVDGWYKCVVGRLNKTPEIKKLSQDVDEALSICHRCKEGRVKIMEHAKIRLENKRLLADLEDERINGKVYMIPSCKRGAKPDENLDYMIGCELANSGGRPRPIKERKNKKDLPPCHKLGSPTYKRCQHISWTQIVIKGQLKKPEK